MRPLCVIDVVGLTPRLLAHAPRIAALAERGKGLPISGVFPALTASAQATYLTGLAPAGHGVVGNGWFFRDLGEAWLWRQSNALIQGEKVYETARTRAAASGDSFTCAKLFWWFNQGAAVDLSVTPRPFYGADGSKVFAIQSSPPDLAADLEGALGPFPFRAFWGPMAGLASSDWIARATARVIARHRPTLTLAYIPHLDYDLQRLGPDHHGTPDRVAEADACAGIVIDAAQSAGAAVCVLSEYGLVPARRPVLVNRALREWGLLAVRPGPFGEGLDTFASRAFAVCDHQIAHVYVRDPADLPAVRERLAALPGVDRVLGEAGKREARIDHPRSGDLVLVADRDAWFAYPWWLDDREAPDFARTVDIHRKPGYDPCELFVDPALRFPKSRVARRLLQKALGFRYLMDVVPLDPSLVKGTHGRVADDPLDGPILVSSAHVSTHERINATDVRDLLLAMME